MKIGILTFSTALNYGAILQTYALQEVLKEMGHDVSVINYNPAYLQKHYRVFSYRPGLRSLVTKKGWESWFYYLSKVIIRRHRRSHLFAKFRNKYLSIRTLRDAVKCRFDIIICGSDQIWNPKITDNRLDDVFFGMIDQPQNTKRIAYAASVGENVNITPYMETFLLKLRNFSSISVREKSLAELINDTKKYSKVETVLDPTLLAGRTIFERLASKKVVNEPYLLYFTLSNNDNLRESSKKFASRNRWAFVEATTYFDYIKGEKFIRIISPNEFCSLIKNARFVVTDSYHATVFSVIFHRLFASYVKPGVGSERFISLLTELNLTNRTVYSSHDFDKKQLCFLNNIDTEFIDNKLEILRQYSLNYLNDAITQS